MGCKLNPAGIVEAGRRVREFLATPAGERLAATTCRVFPVAYVERHPRGWRTGLCTGFADALCAWSAVHTGAVRRALMDTTYADELHHVVQVGDYYLDAGGAWSAKDLLAEWGPAGYMGRLYGVRSSPQLTRYFPAPNACSAVGRATVKMRATRVVPYTELPWASAVARLLDRHVGRAEDLMCVPKGRRSRSQS